MPYVQIGRNRVNYGLQGEPGREVIVFLNGLTQTNSLWANHQERLANQGYRVLTYDMLGQGMSSKPVLGIRLEDHAKLLCQMLDALEIERCYLAGISYGGVVALHSTIHYPERVKGLVAMSTFCEMPGQLEMLGRVLHMAITQAGFPLIQSLLLPMNFSSKWIEQVRTTLPENMRRGYVINDPYAIQNLMESYVNFQPFTQDLARIQCPTLILNGEFDFLTPRICHETLRQHIENCRLMIVPHSFHAFTLEYPENTVRILEAFVRSVEDGSWQGDKSVWVASEDPQSDVLATRCVGDHMRAIFVSPTGEQGQHDAWVVAIRGAAKQDASATQAAPVAATATAPASGTSATKRTPRNKTTAAKTTKATETAKPTTRKAAVPKPVTPATTKTTPKKAVVSGVSKGEKEASAAPKAKKAVAPATPKPATPKPAAPKPTSAKASAVEPSTPSAQAPAVPESATAKAAKALSKPAPAKSASVAKATGEKTADAKPAAKTAVPKTATPKAAAKPAAPAEKPSRKKPAASATTAKR